MTAPFLRELVAAGSAGKLDPSLVVTNVAPLSEAPSALGDHIRGGGIKTVLTALA